MEDIPSHIKNRFGDSFASGNGIAIQAGVNHGTININQTPRQILLPKVGYNATFDAANKEHLPSCLEGTRLELLKQIQAWIDGDNPKKVYWLSGMAGTGKSTIALTLARTYKRTTGAKDRERNVYLGATFFFSRGGGDLSSARNFPATIAIQLAEASRDLRRLVENVIEDNPRLDSLGIREQWGKLVIEPLSRLSGLFQHPGNPTTFLLIVDALDECNGVADTNTIIGCLEEMTHIEGVECRVFLTSRPEQPIRRRMNDRAAAPCENFVLHDIEAWIINQDLELYYRDELGRIRESMSSEEVIIPERTIGKLVERSNGLFIHAATVCKFVREGGWLAAQRLNSLVETQKSDSAELELDKMYTVVLEYSFASVIRGLTADEVEQVHQLFQRVIGTIMVMFDTMSSESLATLLGVKRERITTTLSALHAVIDVPTHHSEPIRILHPSFREFLLDPNRCFGNYSIPVSAAHGHLLTRCVAYLMSQLRRNMLDIAKPGAKARDVSMERFDARVPRELQYSSRYWWSHFKNSDVDSRKQLPLLEFLEDKYLFWLECLAWRGNLGLAIEVMLNLDAILAGKSSQSKLAMSMSSNHWKPKTASQLRTFVSDALQFLLSNKLMIEEAPLQLYVSALIFSPKSSELRKRNLKEIPSWILNEPLVPENRSKLSFEISIAYSSGIHSLAISPDSTLVATACGDCTVRISDANSGTERLRLEGNTDGVASVCFSPNGCLVASFAQNCVSVWNIEGAFGANCKPECQFRFNREGSRRKASAHPICAISPDENLVAVVDFPHDIWIWDMRVKESVKYHFRIQSWYRQITGVYFSSDGSLLICVTGVSYDSHGQETERLYSWDTATGIMVSTERTAPKGPLLGMMPETSYITISPWVSNSGTRLVVRDARTGLDVMGAPLGLGRPIKALWRPTDRRFLLASFEGSGITVWVLGEHRKETFLINDYNHIKSIDFSPNGNYLILAISSNKVSIWNIEGFESKPSRLGEIYQSLVEMSTNWGRQIGIALNLNQMEHLIKRFTIWLRSPDGSVLATGIYRDHTITIWDTRTGEERLHLKNLPDDYVDWVGFSQSGNIFALASDSGFHFWDTKTGRKGVILTVDDEHTSEVLEIPGKDERVVFVSIVILQGHRFRNLKIYTWGLDGLRKISSHEIPVRHHQTSSFELSPNGRLYCLWVRGSAMIEIGSFQTDKLRHMALRGVPKFLGFMPDGKHLWIISAMEEAQRQAIHIWNIEQGGLREVYIDLPRDYPLNKRDATNDDLERYWRAYEPREKYGPEYEKGVVSPDGKLLALISRKTHRNCPKIDVFKTSDLKALFRLQLDFPTREIRFSPSGTHLITERGNILLPRASSPSPLLFATRSWIQENDEDILAIPPAYQDSVRGVYGHTIEFSDRTHQPLFVRLDEGIKTMNA